jgi:hypothetical protein
MIHQQLLCLALFFLYLCSFALGGYLNTQVKTFGVLVGDTMINITKEVFQMPIGCTSCSPDLSFLNLHENENTSVVAARSFLYYNGGSLVKFAKGNSRYVTFKMGNTKYTVDPNRIFTPEGIKATLQSNGPYSDAAATEVQYLADQLLTIYGFNDQLNVLSLHNNGGTYGADSYLPGGVYEDDAEEVNIVAGSNPSDFLYVVDPALYEAIVANEYNAVLQNNATVTNDGSLSYYCGLQGKPYVNFEAEAETTSFGKQILLQLDMIKSIKEIIAGR